MCNEKFKGGLVVCLCALMQAGIIVAAEPERKKTTADEENKVIGGKVEHLVNCEDPSSWEGMVKVNTEIKRSGQFSFELYGKYPTEIICRQMIPVDMGKTYVLSAYLRSLDKNLPASAFMGLRMYDKDKKPITLQNVHAIEGTETTLAADASNESKELLISNNEKWLNAGDRVIAFNASGDFQDLPNYDLSPQIEKVIRDGATSRVILKRPLTKLYPSGTPVRLHSPYGAPFYWVASGWMPAEWKQFSTAMSGESQSGTPSDKFWRGTKYVRVFVWFANYDKIPKEDARLLVDDITFVCRDQTVAEKIIEQQWGKYVAGQQVLAAICRTPKRTIEIDRQWSFATDAQDEGLMSGWMRTDFADQGWPLIDADHWWQDQGYPDYHGVAWYRRTVPPFTLEKGQKCFIHFGAVDGDACVFVNGRKVGERNLGFGGREWDSPLYFEITEDLAVGKQNVIAVRVKKNEYKSGIYKGVKIIHINNIGKGE